MLMDFVQTLDNEKQQEITSEYEIYAKNCIRNKETPMHPELWLSTKQELIKQFEVQTLAIRNNFRKLMLENGHGEVIERARFFVKGY